jgi:hypothetical protein
MKQGGRLARLKQYSSASFAKGDFEQWKDVQAAKQKWHFLNQGPGDTYSNPEAIHLHMNLANKIRDATARNTVYFANTFATSLLKTQGLARLQREHCQIGSRINVQTGLNPMAAISQPYVGDWTPNDPKARTFPLVTESDHTSNSTSRPRWGILVTKGIFPGYFFFTRFNMASKSVPLAAKRPFTKTTYWLAYRLVSSFRKASKFLLIGMLKYIRSWRGESVFPASSAYDINTDSLVNVLDAQVLTNVILQTRSCP